MLAEGTITLGNGLSGETIDLEAGGAISGGNMTAGDSVYAEAGGPIDLLDISAGLVNPSSFEGVLYSVGILSASTIDTGNIWRSRALAGALGNMPLATSTSAISPGAGRRRHELGSIESGGTTYLANASMPGSAAISRRRVRPGPILRQRRSPAAARSRFAALPTRQFRASSGTSSPRRHFSTDQYRIESRGNW